MPCRAKKLQQSEQRIKEAIKALELKVLTHRQAATAQLAHALATIGINPESALAGQEGFLPYIVEQFHRHSLHARLSSVALMLQCQ